MLQVVLTECNLLVYNFELVLYIYAGFNIICMHKIVVESV